MWVTELQQGPGSSRTVYCADAGVLVKQVVLRERDGRMINHFGRCMGAEVQAGNPRFGIRRRMLSAEPWENSTRAATAATAYPDPWTCIFQKLSGPQGPSWVAAFRTISKAGTARPSRWRIARGFAQSFDLASRMYYGDPGSGRLAVHERHRPGPEKVGPGRGSKGSDASVRTSKLAAHSVVHVLQRSSAKRQGVAMNGIHAGTRASR